jgi:hypothetical protein
VNQDERARVIHGQVKYKDEWIPIDEKAARETDFIRRVKQGFVKDGDNWIKIADKIIKEKTPATPQFPPDVFSNVPPPYTPPQVSRTPVYQEPVSPPSPVTPVPAPVPYSPLQDILQPEQPQVNPQENVSFSQYLDNAFPAQNKGSFEPDETPPGSV